MKIQRNNNSQRRTLIKYFNLNWTTQKKYILNQKVVRDKKFNHHLLTIMPSKLQKIIIQKSNLIYNRNNVMIKQIWFQVLMKQLTKKSQNILISQRNLSLKLSFRRLKLREDFQITCSLDLKIMWKRWTRKKSMIRFAAFLRLNGYI